MIDDDEEPIPRIRPVRRPGRWAAVGVCLVLGAMFVNALVTNPAFQWPVVREFFTTEAVIGGLVTSLWLTAAAAAGGFAAGTVLALMRLGGGPVLRTLSWGYVWVFRSIPLLVQLLFWFNIAALYQRLSLGIPFGPELVSFQTTNVISPLMAAFIGLTLHEAAYASEVVRAGILSVDQGQIDAAHALGLSRLRILRRIVLPQAMRSIIPPAGNLVVGLLKATSMVSVIAVQDLLYSVQVIYNRNYLIIPLLLVATLWYLIVTSILSVVQYYIERFYARGSARELPPTPWERLRTRIAVISS